MSTIGSQPISQISDNGYNKVGKNDASDSRKRGPSCSPITYAYENTTQSSGLRKLLTDLYTWNIDLEWYERPAVWEFLRQQPNLAIDLKVKFAKELKKGLHRVSFLRS